MHPSSAPKYRDVFALPKVRHTFVTALIGRSAYALVLLPLLYAVAEATGSIALAGGAIALYGAAASFLAPVRAALIDRWGARRMLTGMVLLFGGTILALAFTALLDGSAGTLLALCALAGIVAPPLGPTMRVAWGSLTPDAALLKKGLSCDSVVEELLYLAGPAAAGVGLAFVSPGIALLVPAVLVIVGGLLFVGTSTVGAMKPRTRVTTEAGQPFPTARPLIFGGRFVGLLMPAVVAGGIAGMLSVAIPVALDNYGGPAAAGIALGLFAGGSVVGGLIYGALQVPGSAARQLVVFAAILSALASVVAVAVGAVAISIVLVAAGLFFSPVMIVAYIAAHAAGGEHRQNSATTWVNTSHNLGGAVGSASTGVLIQAAGMSAAILSTTAVALLLISISAVIGWRTVRREA